MPKPIFIVGIPRSGTTWLANILCQHSKIAGVQNEPYGIWESAYFTHVETYFGSLKDNQNFIQFVETFGCSDYFRFTGLDKDLYYKNRPKTYTQAFRLLMDTFAKKYNADYWLEKSPGHSLYLNKLSKYFKDAKFIGMKRNIMDATKSAVRGTYLKSNLVKKLYILRRVIRHNKYVKHLEKFESISNCILLINYEALKNDTKEVVTKICNFLGIKYEPNLLRQKFKSNTSFSNFTNKKEREMVLTNSEEKILKLLNSIITMIPYKLYRIFYYFQVNLRGKYFPPWFWNRYEKEKFQDLRKNALSSE